MWYEVPDEERTGGLLPNDFDARTGHQAPAMASPPATCSAPRIHYVDEAELASLVRSDEVGSDTNVAAEFGAAANFAELARLVGSVVHILGFRRLAYLAVKTDARGRVDHVYLLRNAFWSGPTQRMLCTGMLERNASLRAVLTSYVPQCWELKTLRGGCGAGEFAEQDLQLIDEMHEQGLRSGLALGLPISDTSMRSIVILASPREAAADWSSEDIVIQCLTLVSSLHQRCAAYIRAAHRLEAFGSLSPQRQQIVDLLVRGLSDKEIAIRLNMSAHTVDYHLRHLKERYRALDRAHLAFIVGAYRA